MLAIFPHSGLPSVLTFTTTGLSIETAWLGTGFAHVAYCRTFRAVSGSPWLSFASTGGGIVARWRVWSNLAWRWIAGR